MDSKTIERLARAAQVLKDGQQWGGTSEYRVVQAVLAMFATLVARHVAEECAKLCDAAEQEAIANAGGYRAHEDHFAIETARECGKNIRAKFGLA